MNSVKSLLASNHLPRFMSLFYSGLTSSRCRNISVLQSCLSKITLIREKDLDRARRYFEMLYLTHEVINKSSSLVTMQPVSCSLEHLAFMVYPVFIACWNLLSYYLPFHAFPFVNTNWKLGHLPPKTSEHLYCCSYTFTCSVCSELAKQSDSTHWIAMYTSHC